MIPMRGNLAGAGSHCDKQNVGVASSQGNTTTDMTVGGYFVNNNRSSHKLQVGEHASVNMDSVSIYDDFGTPSGQPHKNVTEITEEDNLMKNSMLSQRQRVNVSAMHPRRMYQKFQDKVKQ